MGIFTQIVYNSSIDLDSFYGNLCQKFKKNDVDL